MQETAIIAAAAAVAGVIIGSASTYLVAKKNLKKEVSLKMAEYRLQWINKLGDEFADFSAHAMHVFFERDEVKQKVLIYGTMKCYSKTQMLMNVRDPDYGRLNQAMGDLMSYAGEHRGNKITEQSIDKFHSKNREFMKIANLILKREWTKTKNHLRLDTVKVSALKSESDKDYIDRIVERENERREKIKSPD